MKGVIEA